MCQTATQHLPSATQKARLSWQFLWRTICLNSPPEPHLSRAQDYFHLRAAYCAGHIVCRLYTSKSFWKREPLLRTCPHNWLCGEACDALSYSMTNVGGSSSREWCHLCAGGTMCFFISRLSKLLGTSQQVALLRDFSIIPCQQVPDLTSLDDGKTCKMK